MLPPVTPTPNTRTIVVNVLEYTYGPLLVGLLFCVILITQDPAQEVILGLARELELPSIGQYFQLFTADDPSAALLGYVDDASVRNSMGSILLWTLPVCVWSAATFALRNRPPQVYRAAKVIPFLAGLGVFAGIAYGIYTASQSPEAASLDPAQFRLLYIRAVLGAVLGALLHRSLAIISGVPLAARVPTFQEVLSAIIIVVLFLLPVLVFGFLRPDLAALIGPVGISASFAITATYVFAGLTILSKRIPGNFPLIIIVILLAWASTSMTIALVLTVGAGLPVLIWAFSSRRNTALGRTMARLNTALSRFGPWRWISGLSAVQASLDMKWPGTVALTLVTIVAGGAAILSRPVPACGTLPGCNLLVGSAPQTRHDMSVVEAFGAWSGRSAPTVRLVAAQGGGLYAAYHTAYYLAARADEDKEFAKSVFAISGVSGGSVGAGVFWSVVASGACADAAEGSDCHRKAVSAILRYDFLSPALAGFFFRDAVDTVVPISYFNDQPIDRARVLEDAIAARLESWVDDLPTQPGGKTGFIPHQLWLDTPLADSWATDAGVPLLLLNATEVGTGELRVLSPLPFLDRVASDGKERQSAVPLTHMARVGLEGGNDLSVGDAMVTSARFPLVTPPARVRVRDAAGNVVTRQLVDGGYFDNSGIETLFEIVDGIAAHRAGVGTVEVLLFSVEEIPPNIDIKGTIGAPVNAFTSAWRARRALTARRFTEELDEMPDQTSAPTICESRLFQKQSNFTVSWFLTNETFNDIEDQIEAEVLPRIVAPELCKQYEQP